MKVVFDTTVLVAALVFPGRQVECAAEADAIVTGDREMLALGERAGVRIVSLAEYLAA